MPRKDEDQPYTAFEAGGDLYQFTSLPFGVTIGAACFQRKTMKFSDKNYSEVSFLITSLFAARTKKIMMLIWNTFLKLPNMRTSVR